MWSLLKHTPSYFHICFVTFTFEYSSQSSEVHLVRTVEDNNILSQTATHVFCCLSLAYKHKQVSSHPIMSCNYLNCGKKEQQSNFTSVIQ